MPQASTVTPPPQNPGLDLKAERDRFVALAFCWADFLLEVDMNEAIVFAGGPWQAITGMTTQQLVGKKLDDIVLAEDMGLMRSLLGVARRQGRIEDVDIRFKGQRKSGLPFGFAGYFLEDLGNHYFLALRVSRNPGAGLVHGGQKATESNLYDANSFADVLGGKLKSAKPGEDNQLTLINMPGMAELKARLDADQTAELDKILGTYLRANSVDGDSAAELDEGKFGLVHADDLDVSSLESQLANVAKDFDPDKKGISVEAATMAVDAENISEEDMANGLVYAINRFKESGGSAGFNMQELSSNLSSLVSEAAEKVSTFKATVANKNFHLVYHPIVNVMTGAVHHYEALTRFEEGVSPYEIITMAEETGLIPEFDLAVVEKGLEFLNTIPRNNPMSIAVNISGQSVASEWYVNALHNIMSDNKWAKGRMVFEITESAKMEDLESANNFIQRLRKDGYPVCLDDFGAGAASFGYLMRLEVDVVKIDGPVVKDAQRARRGKALFESMATLCKNLGIETIAEMVDDQQGLDFVRKCGIDFAQGYLFGKPNANTKAFNMAKHIHMFPNPAFSTGRTW
ncbi:sensor domain-containing phosphodiesterase [Magnetovibrio sp.]|uniref:sensor domain-containing phosphodiesterase n=1 Tax=Magnetovibrio sp. TaxID=2024836 RepID=UPI002F959C59